MGNIHATAIVDPKARIGKDVSIGAYCVIGPDVTLGDNVVLESHVAVAGRTAIGAGSHVFPFASLGHAPQDLKYKGEPSTLTIGTHAIIREYVTMNPGTEGGGMHTTVGDHCLFMAGSHVAHDCKVGNYVILANNATLAGHVTVGDHAIIGGLSAIHQFVRIGKHAIIGGMSGIESDVIPFGSAMGERANLAGLNLVGLKRRGFVREDIHGLRAAYRIIFDPSLGHFADRLKQAEKQLADRPAVRELLDFLLADSSRAICKPLSADLEDEQAA
ncbi:MAG: acyl-ACP--UDP-N-acetylglucosamine O-acyltransferase [Alphaproteobacteria bacterium]|nr:acyl-ACP--UDP-N-acetylglucosamine O-acyltransferase [Alphaproteobacteria bacterium]